MAFPREAEGVAIVNALKDQVSGKTIVITGASENGLGGESAVALAHGNPASLFLTARSQKKVDSIISRINEINPNIKAVFVSMELDDLDSVRAAAKTINDSTDKINLLMNNAGIMAIEKYTTNKAGIEIQFATNHIGHFLFTKLLMPKILAAGAGSRIVNLTSMGHKIGPVRFDDYNFKDGKEYDPWSGYGQAKTANILFSKQLALKLKDKGIYSFSVHPGVIFGTSLATHIGDVHQSLDEACRVAFKNTGKEFPLNDDAPKPISQGISTQIAASLDPSIIDKTGSWLMDCKVTPAYDYAESEENAQKLWELSEKLIGEKWEL